MTVGRWSPLAVGAEEIGRVLREARERLGLQLADAEDATHIRVTYLAALEREQFERLPGRAYTRSFLREYALFLGLDPAPLLDAFAERVPDEEAPALRPIGIEHGPQIRWDRLVLAVGGLALVLIGGVAAWQFGGGRNAVVSTPRTHAEAAAPRPSPSARRHQQAPAPIQLVLRARGNCWLWIRARSTLGPVVYEGTLTAGRTLRYTLSPRRQQLWVRIGAPWNLDVLLNNRNLSGLPPVPGNILITRRGIEPG